jgi:hypothetical protein
MGISENIQLSAKVLLVSGLLPVFGMLVNA